MLNFFLVQIDYPSIKYSFDIKGGSKKCSLRLLFSLFLHYMLHHNLEYLAVVLLDDLVAFLWITAFNLFGMELMRSLHRVLLLEIRRQDALISALISAML